MTATRSRAYSSGLVTEGDRIHSNDTFDVADAERALARFGERCAALA